MSRIYLLNYNNYANRIVKGIVNNAAVTSIGHYTDADTGYLKFDDINFYRGDGVNTTQTINFTAAEKDADYLIVAEVAGTPPNETVTIVSRWFIIECNYNRRRQMLLTLRRDLIVDYWASIYTNAITDGFFCEKGAVDKSDNFIFNPENMTFNQVLTTRTILGPSTGRGSTGYIVGYLDKKSSELLIHSTTEINYTVVATRDDIPVWKAYKEKTFIGGTPVYNYDFVAVDGLPKDENTGGDTVYMWYVHVNNSQPVAGTGQYFDTQLGAGYGSTIGEYEMETRHQHQAIYNFLTASGASDISDVITEYLKNGLNVVSSEDFDYSEDIVYYITSENRFVQPKITVSSSYSAYTSVPQDYEDYVNSFVGSIWAAFYSNGWVDGDHGYCPIRALKYKFYPATVSFDDVTSTYTIGKVPKYSNRDHVNAPYDIFVTEYSDAALLDASRIASGLYGSGALIDLQRLPYVPTHLSNKTWTVGNTTFYWLTTDTATNVPSPITWEKNYTNTNRVDFKVDALTKKLRVESPNHANAWDFIPAMNRGVSAWTYDIMLKPYQPYIHIAPTFNDTGLYRKAGTIEKDQRGLVCTGSFSLPISSDAWATYQINNAAYMNAFERDVEHMEKIQDVERMQQNLGILGNVIGSTVRGATEGAGMGGIPGAIAGGALGAAGSGVAGIIDYDMAEKLRNEAIDYSKDQFGYSLQNIAARPRTFSQSSSFDPNNTIFPYIDYYTATSEEDSALAAKIKRNGMTIMRIGSFKTFWNSANTDVPYIKGKLIRLPSSFKDDTHVFNEIANELYKGVYKA